MLYRRTFAQHRTAEFFLLGFGIFYVFIPGVMKFYTATWISMSYRL